MAWLDLQDDIAELFGGLAQVDRRAVANDGAEHLSIWRRRVTRAEMRAEGLCICGRPLRVHKGKIRSECVVCALRSSKAQRERHAANTAAGVCWCGAPRAPQRSRCATHLASEVARADAKRRTNAKLGLCLCGRKAASGRLECERCLDAKKSAYQRRRAVLHLQRDEAA